MSALKDTFFALRDRLRFVWARNKFTYMPFGKAEDFDLNEMRHIVILKVDGKLGDTQVMTHFYRSLRENIHDLTLSVVCSPNLAPLYSEILVFDQVITCSRKPRKSEIEYICERLTGPESPCQYVDLVVTTEPHFKPRDFIFNYNLRPRFVAGCEPLLKDHEINLFLFDPDSDTRPVATCFTDFMTRGHLDYPPLHYMPLYTEETLRSVKSQFTTPVIGINPCGAASNRCLTVSMVSSLIERLEPFAKTSPLTVLLLCPKSQQDFVAAVQERCKGLVAPAPAGAGAAAAPEGAGAEAAGSAGGLRLRALPEVDVELYAAYIGALAALITVDTAAVHLACASDVPQLCVYMGDGNSLNDKRWGPRSSLARVLPSHTERLDEMDAELFVSSSLAFLQETLGL